MTKRKKPEGNGVDGDQSVPIPIQTFLWRQTRYDRQCYLYVILSIYYTPVCYANLAFHTPFSQFCYGKGGVAYSYILYLSKCLRGYHYQFVSNFFNVHRCFFLNFIPVTD